MGVELASGTELAGYRIESLVGRGAMGAVYLATDLRLERRVALKVLSTELARDERFRERFLRESRIAASLDHPHIVPVFATGEVDGVLFLAMRFVQGSDLHDVIGRVGRLEPGRALELLSQVADALDTAHAAGLVHRDVKPGNILVTHGREGAEHAYLCDFGLAKHAATVASLTSERSLVGTIDYIAPEQVEGGAVDGRADVYGLGCVLYECLAGAPPFRRGMELAVVYAHLNDPPPLLSERRPELPAALDAVITRALAKDPAARFPTAGELVRAARAALAGAAPDEPPPAARALVRTFLIADVRGYTAYTRAHGDAAAARLAEHFAQLARQSVELHHGELVEIRGDEALAVFDSTRDALRAGVALQRQSRSAELERGIGVGIDAGEAIPVDQGYRGAALNLAARLCSSCRAGEILASDHATHLAGRIDGIRYLRRKPMQLKGLDAPISPVEVLPDEPYPAVASAAVPPAGPRRRPRWRRQVVAATAGVVAVGGALGAAVALRSSSSHHRAATLPARGDAVVAIAPGTGRIVARIPLPGGSSPGAIAVGAGAVWVADTGNNTIARIDPRTRQPVVKGVPGSVLAVAADQASVWVVGGAEPAAHRLPLYRLDPTTGGVIDTIRIPNLRGFEGTVPNDDVTLGGGALWLVLAGEYLQAEDLVHVPMDGVGIQRIEGATGSFLGPLAYAGGEVWAVGKSAPNGLSGLVLRVAATGKRPSPAIFERIGKPGDLASMAAGDGAVWLVGRDGTLWRIDPASNTLVGAPIALGQGDWSGLAVGDGAVWVVSSRDGRLVRVDLKTRAVTGISLGQPAERVAVGAGVVWVTTHATAAPASAAAGEGGTLRVLSGDSGFWDGTSYFGNDWALEDVTCNGLLDYPSTRDRRRQMTLVPTVAAALPTISSDGKTYVFRIRRGLRFSDGRAVTPEDVKDTYLRNLDPKAGFDALVNTPYYDVIAGMPAYRKGAHTISGITVRGDTLSFHLTRPDPAFEYATQMRFMCIVPRGTPHGHTPLPPPATGPYMTDSFRPGRSLVLVRNPYWAANARAMGIDTRGLDNVDRIEVRFDVPPEKQLLAVARNQADLTGPGWLAGPTLERGTRQPGNPPLVVGSGGINFLWMNEKIPPFSNAMVRRAVNYAVDRTTLARVEDDELLLPWSNILPSNLVSADAEREPYPLTADRVEARRLIEQSGLKRPMAITYWYGQSGHTDAAARAIAAELDAVGFRVTLRPVGRDSYGTLLNRAPHLQLFGFGWTQDFPDAATFFEPIFNVRGSGNLGGFDVPAVNRQIDQIATMSLGDARQRAWNALAATIATRYAPVVVLADQHAAAFRSTRVDNLVWNYGTNSIDLALISLAR